MTGARAFPTLNMIGGVWRAGERFADIEDPATGRSVASVAMGNGETAREAIAAAASAQPAWSAESAYARGAILRTIGDRIRIRLEELAPILTLEAGKRLAEARAEWLAAAALFEWYAEEGKRAYGRIVPAAKVDRRILVLPQPIGVVAAITAWNFPAYLPARKWSAALAAGCTVVARPSSTAPLSALLLAEIAQEAGIPPGVLNVILGPASEIADVFLDDERVAKISLTGSATAGRYLLDGASRTFTKLSLELGGSAPVLVFDDADIDQAVDMSIGSKFRNAGQVCISPSRFLVQRGVGAAFTSALVDRVSNLRLGHGLDPLTDVGPVIDGEGVARIERLVTDAVHRGARVLAGGRPIAGDGHFVEPTVVVGVEPPMNLFQEEIFGPVAAVTTFETDDEAVAKANTTSSGLAAYVHTTNLSRAMHASENLQFGIVGVNDMLPATAEAPFGGWKASGNASEGGLEGLREYLQTKYVALGV